MKKFLNTLFTSKVNFADLAVILLVVYLLKMTYLLSKPILDAPPSQLKINLLITGVLLTSFLLAIEVSKRHLCERFDKNQKTWFCLTIYLMVSTLVLGYVFIDTKFNNNEINLVLRESYNDEAGTVKGNITCVPNTGKYLMYGEVVLCRPQPVLHNGTNEVIFYLRNGTSIREKPTGSFTFRAPEGTRSIEFHVTGFDQNQEFHYFVVSNSVDFIKPEDKEKYEDRYITLFIWLIGVMFLIPTMMNNVKNLWK